LCTTLGAARISALRRGAFGRAWAKDAFVCTDDTVLHFCDLA
jgi:hypothetical protein